MGMGYRGMGDMGNRGMGYKGMDHMGNESNYQQGHMGNRAQGYGPHEVTCTA